MHFRKFEFVSDLKARPLLHPRYGVLRVSDSCRSSHCAGHHVRWSQRDREGLPPSPSHLRTASASQGLWRGRRGTQRKSVNISASRQPLRRWVLARGGTVQEASARRDPAFDEPPSPGFGEPGAMAWQARNSAAKRYVSAWLQPLRRLVLTGWAMARAALPCRGQEMFGRA